MSELVRTFAENGTEAPITATAAPRGWWVVGGGWWWVLGGGVRGGRIAGEQTALTATMLFQQRDMPVLNEYRALLGGLFTRLYGLSAAQRAQVFPDAGIADLGLV